MLNHILFLIAGLVFLIFGGNILVSGASSFALRMKMSPMLVGLTIVAFGTSAPELFVSIQSAFKGSPDISMGNVVGSNICNIALVLGVMASLSIIPINSNTIKFDWPIAMGSSLLLALFAWDLNIAQWEGAVLILLLVGYLIWQFYIGSQEENEVSDEVDSLDLGLQHLLKDIAYIIVGIVGLYFGSEWFVGGAKDIAISLNISERIVGITVVAIGTSLPELVTSLIASYKKETDLAMGNLIGSNIFNILCILGITASIQPIQINADIMNTDIWWMCGIMFILLPFMLINKKIYRWQGIFFLVIYVYYTYQLTASF